MTTASSVYNLAGSNLIVLNLINLELGGVAKMLKNLTVSRYLQPSLQPSLQLGKSNTNFTEIAY